MCSTTESYADDTITTLGTQRDTTELDEKTLAAERRSYHSFFDIHVVQTDDGYILIEEQDYGELPMHLIDDIVYTAQGKMSDEY